jgi:hypothetical protein
MPERDTFEEPRPEPAIPRREAEIASPEMPEPPAGMPDTVLSSEPPEVPEPPARPTKFSNDPPPGFPPLPDVVAPILMPFPTKNA